jgi:hypothetical protein
MNFGICLNGFVALRAEPKSSAEMGSSLVFGEQYEVLSEVTDDWLQIKSISDGYKAWLSQSNHNPLAKTLELEVFDSIATVQNEETAETIHLSPGCYIPDFKNDQFTLAGNEFNFISEMELTSNAIVEVAELYMGTPYLWGGRSIYGIDCSGFAQMVYRANGIFIPRDSKPQSELSDKKMPFGELKEGDLAFFKNKENRINHVGIVLGNDEIIHASGSVHIDEFDIEGIYNQHGKLTHPFAWGLRKPVVK